MRTPGGTGRTILTARFDLGGDETDLVHTGGVGEIDDVGYVDEGDGIITLHKHDLFRALLIDVSEAPLQIVPSRIFVVDLDAGILSGAAVDQLDDDGAVGSIVFGRVRRRRLRKQR